MKGFISFLTVLVMIMNFMYNIEIRLRNEEAFDTYFAISPDRSKEERVLIKPMVIKRLVELKDEAIHNGFMVGDIYSKRFLTATEIEDQIVKWLEAKKREKTSWLNYDTACEAARYYDYVDSECNAIITLIKE